MKRLLVPIVILALLVLGLPVAMGGMSECPMCTSPDLQTPVGICAVLSLVVLLMLFSAFKIAANRTDLHEQFTGGSIYRPPRSA